MRAAALTGSRTMSSVELADGPPPSGQVDVSPLISEVVPVTVTPDAFARLSDGHDGLHKILVSPDA